MSVIWGTNYAIIKSAFQQLDPHAFNAARMVIASGAFLAIIGLLRLKPAPAPADDIDSVFRTPTRMTRRDWLELAVLGFVGHFLYQYFFIGGLALTTVANSSLMLATTPVVIALISAVLGYERVGARHWAGAALSLRGHLHRRRPRRGARRTGPHGGSDDGRGRVVLGSVHARLAPPDLTPLAGRRHGPLDVDRDPRLRARDVVLHVRAVSWGDVTLRTWASIVYSSIFALGVAYTIWYAAVRQIGSARTSVYSNVIPIVAMLTAVLFLGEPLRLVNVIGATAVLVGVALTRTAPQTAPAEPCEP